MPEPIPILDQFVDCIPAFTATGLHEEIKCRLGLLSGPAIQMSFKSNLALSCINFGIASL